MTESSTTSNLSFEAFLPQPVRDRAVRLTSGGAGWRQDDMETIIRTLTDRNLAISGMEAWVVADDTPEGWEPFRNPQFDNTRSDKFPPGFVPPWNRTADGRVIWTVLPGKDGESGVFGMASGDEPLEDEAWPDFVQRRAAYARQVVADTQEDVLPEVAQQIFFDIEAVREGELDDPTS